MPTYTVHVHAGALDAQRKARLAEGITRIHNEVTGAQTFFAQVVFNEIAAGNWFMGGAPLEGPQLFLHGQIRGGGRPLELKQRLLKALCEEVAEGAGIAKNRVWVYLVDLEPGLMIEYGHILPQPGQEKEWLAGLPAEDRSLMENVGRKRS
jgi:phenylpyruvate tautomerase PptA (4-oxalocrotonate tautomerase family)